MSVRWHGCRSASLTSSLLRETRASYAEEMTLRKARVASLRRHIMSALRPILGGSTRANGLASWNLALPMDLARALPPTMSSFIP